MAEVEKYDSSGRFIAAGSQWTEGVGWAGYAIVICIGGAFYFFGGLYIATSRADLILPIVMMTILLSGALVLYLFVRHRKRSVLFTADGEIVMHGDTPNLWEIVIPKSWIAMIPPEWRQEKLNLRTSDIDSIAVEMEEPVPKEGGKRFRVAIYSRRGRIVPVATDMLYDDAYRISTELNLALKEVRKGYR